jgi:hypothetical protein
MADNSFDTMVEDMQTQLEEEKELEQQLFDERLEEMDWYWDEVDRIMGEGTESVLDTMQLYLDDFNEASELQQVELLKGWEDTFGQAAAIGKAGASTMQGIIAEIQQELNNENVEEYLKYLTDDTVNTQYTGRTNYTDDTKKTTTNNNNNNKNTTTTTKPKTTNDIINEVNNELNTEVDKDTLVDKSIDNPDKGNGPTYKKNQHLKTREAWGWVTTYKYNNNKMTSNVADQGALLGKAADFKVDGDPVLYDGQWYYKIKDSTVERAFPNGKWVKGHQVKPYKTGGMVYSTGPAWLDGTSSQPEAVLNAMQTKAFLSFTDDLAALRAEGGMSTNSSVIIDSISFNVESMSSVADGEKAFNAFVDKFKEIGAKQGISVLGTANRN